MTMKRRRCRRRSVSLSSVSSRTPALTILVLLVLLLRSKEGNAWIQRNLATLIRSKRSSGISCHQKASTALCASKRAHITRPPYRLGGQAYLGPKQNNQRNGSDLVEHLTLEEQDDSEYSDATPAAAAAVNNVSRRASNKTQFQGMHLLHDDDLVDTNIFESKSNITVTALQNSESGSSISNVSAEEQRRPTTQSSTNFFSNAFPMATNSNNNKGTKVRRASTRKKQRSPWKDSRESASSIGRIEGLDKNAVITVGDLERILEANGYVKRSDLLSSSSSISTSTIQSRPKTADELLSATLTRQTKSGVALPQLSVLSYRDLTVGCTIAAGLSGMILSTTILPNLWLLGAVSGALYGYDLSKKAREKQPTFVLNNLIVQSGRKLAKSYLLVYDAINGIWFMYRTGQLSYSYYKQYSKLDQRFGLGDKMDAWNARFQEGKERFDRWERENEVGRRVLAGLRTAWMVGEKRRSKRRSKYRVVQAFYDTASYVRRLLTAFWDAATGGGGSELREILRGIRIDVSESRMNEIGPRIGAAGTALVTIYMVGALYSLSARLLGFLAIITGLVWPTWVIELGDRFQLLFQELRAKGRGEEPPVDYSSSSSSGRSRILPTSLRFQRVDKKRYHYFTRPDGSKRWYRTGRPAFRSSKPLETQGPWWSTGSDRFVKTNKTEKEGQRSRWNLFGS